MTELLESDNGRGEALAVATLAGDLAMRRRLSAALVAGGLRVASEAAEPEQLAAGAEPRAVAIALPALSSAELARIGRLRAALTEASIVAVAAAWDRRSISQALREGADGCVVAGRIEESLALAVRDACSGQLSLPRELRNGLVKPLLSPREKQILAMVVLGFTNGEIARKLYLTESTIKSHLSSSFAKLGVRSRQEAAAAILDPDTGFGTGILAISEQDAASAPAEPEQVHAG
jgi:DNA-binding NarL/FixJ family response regulator